MFSVNTLVLGMRGNGKTCALASMYSIMTYGVNCFSLSAIDRMQKRLLNEHWNGMKNGRLPDGTAEGKQFELICSHSFKPVCQVNWYDYPGGWVEMADDRIEDLEKRIITADCVICCIPTDELIHAFKTNTYPECIQNYNDLFMSFGRHYENKMRYVPIVFMVTKSDLCKDKNVIKEAIIKYINLSPFSSKSDKWLLVVIPVSLGNNVRIFDDKDGNHCIDEGTLEPEQIHLPILFSVCKKLSYYLQEKVSLLKEKKKSFEQIAEEIQKIENQIFVWNKNGKLTEKYTDISMIKNELENLINDADNIGRNLELVRGELIEGIQLAYYSGEKIDEADIHEIL